MPVLKAWEEAVKRNPIHICDEVALQLLYPDYPHRLLSDRYNCCPLQGLEKKQAFIWHFHGRTHVHKRAIKLWWPAYQECLRDKVGGVQQWTPSEDPQLIEYLNQGK